MANDKKPAAVETSSPSGEADKLSTAAESIQTDAEVLTSTQEELVKKIMENPEAAAVALIKGNQERIKEAAAGLMDVLEAEGVNPKSRGTEVLENSLNAITGNPAEVISNGKAFLNDLFESESKPVSVEADPADLGKKSSPATILQEDGNEPLVPAKKPSASRA